MSEKLILMPERLTAENGAKYALSGEFHESVTVQCHECHDGDDRDDCEVCAGRGEVTQRVTVEWSTVKEIYKQAIELLGKPQETFLQRVLRRLWR